MFETHPASVALGSAGSAPELVAVASLASASIAFPGSAALEISELVASSTR